MRTLHAAIRGAAAIAALTVGAIAGVPTASAHMRAKGTDRVEHVRRSSHRRRTHQKGTHHKRHHKRSHHKTAHHKKAHHKKAHHKRTHHKQAANHGRRRSRCKARTAARYRLKCRTNRARCRLAVTAKHRARCRALTSARKRLHPKKSHRHPTQPAATTPPTVPAPTTAAPAAPPAPTSVQPAGVSGNWNLTFDDEFNGSAINTSVWNNHDGWTNQNNVTDHASNVVESGGDAILTLASSSSGATIGTNQNVLAVGDFAEARVEFAGSGTTIYNWPAWWASGPNWPSAGENDIAEGLGTLTVNYHSPSGSHNQGTVPGDWAGAFHTYGIYRGSNYCNVYWDGQLVKHYSTDDNGQPQQLLFTMGASNTLQFGSAGQMKVDYVRVWAPA